MTSPSASAIVETISKYKSALMPTRPTLRALSMCAMPAVTVQKMIGAISILMSLMKPSPSAFTQSLPAMSGASQPRRNPKTMAVSTCT